MTLNTRNWIESLDLSVYTYNLIKKYYRYIDQLEKVSDAELLAIPNFGTKRLHEIRERIAIYRGQKWR